MTAPPWFPFYARDWLVNEEVGTMTLEEEGAYVRLLATQWEYGSIPNDERRLCALLKRCDPRRFRRLWPVLAPHFAPISDGRLANPRLAQERERYEQAAGARREMASRAARKRWETLEHEVPGALPAAKQSDVNGIAGDVPADCKIIDAEGLGGEGARAREVLRHTLTARWASTAGLSPVYGPETMTELTRQVDRVLQNRGQGYPPGLAGWSQRLLDAFVLLVQHWRAQGATSMVATPGQMARENTLAIVLDIAEGRLDMAAAPLPGSPKGNNPRGGGRLPIARRS